MKAYQNYTLKRSTTLLVLHVIHLKGVLTKTANLKRGSISNQYLSLMSWYLTACSKNGGGVISTVNWQDWYFAALGNRCIHYEEVLVALSLINDSYCVEVNGEWHWKKKLGFGSVFFEHFHVCKLLKHCLQADIFFAFVYSEVNTVVLDSCAIIKWALWALGKIHNLFRWCIWAPIEHGLHRQECECIFMQYGLCVAHAWYWIEANWFVKNSELLSVSIINNSLNSWITQHFLKEIQR